MTTNADGDLDLHTLAVNLGEAGARAEQEVKALIEASAIKIKTRTRKSWDGLNRARHLAKAVDWEMKGSAGSNIIAEIGVNKQRMQGPLGNIIEYGTIKNAPIPALGPAMKHEEPILFRALMEIAGRTLE